MRAKFRQCNTNVLHQHHKYNLQQLLLTIDCTDKRARYSTHNTIYCVIAVREKCSLSLPKKKRILNEQKFEEKKTKTQSEELRYYYQIEKEKQFQINRKFLKLFCVF